MLNHPTAEPLVVDPKIAAALDHYCDLAGGMRPNEFVERAILCYLLSKKTLLSWEAIREAGFFGEDNEQASLANDEESK
jgi:hypothetical protein